MIGTTLVLGEEPPVIDPPTRVPVAVWVLAWSCLAGQLLLLGERGVQSSDAVLLSIPVGALLVAWVSFGVLTGRTVRLVLVWVLFVATAVGDGVVLLDAGATGVTGWPLVQLAASMVQLGALASFTRTDYFAWQRSRPRVPGPPVGSLIAVAVAVGVLGGLTPSPAPALAPTQFSVNL